MRAVDAGGAGEGIFGEVVNRHYKKKIRLVVSVTFLDRFSLAILKIFYSVLFTLN